MAEAAIPLSTLDHHARGGNPLLMLVYAAMLTAGNGFALVQQRYCKLCEASFYRKSIRRLASVTPDVLMISCRMISSVYAVAAAAAVQTQISTFVIETQAEWIHLAKEAASTASQVIRTAVAGTA